MRPVQVAYCVADADAAAHRWAQETGAGPFFLNRHIPVHDAIHRGEPIEFDHTSAYGQWGDVMVELVQDHSDGPSPVRDIYDLGDEGLHHMAFFVDDLDAELARLDRIGFPTIFRAVAGATPFAFADAQRRLGHLLELYPRSDRLVGFYEMVRSSSLGWDGADPVREL